MRSQTDEDQRDPQATILPDPGRTYIVPTFVCYISYRPVELIRRVTCSFQFHIIVSKNHGLLTAVSNIYDEYRRDQQADEQHHPSNFL